MLNWSPIGYKMTLGIGMLGLTVMSAEMWQKEVDVWSLMAAIWAPIVVFVFVDAEQDTLFCRISQGVASAWYLGFATAIVFAYSTQNVVPPTWLIYALLVAWGAIPCVAAIYLIGAATIRDLLARTRRDLAREAEEAWPGPDAFDPDYP